VAASAEERRTTVERTLSARWMVVGLLTLGMAIAYADRVNLSVAITDIGAALGLSAAQRGFALSAFFISYTVLQIPAGWMVDRYGIRRLYIVAFFLWSVASVATAFAASFASLCAIRMLLGLGEAVVIPASMRYIREHFDEKDRGMAVGVFMTGSKIGPAVAFPVAASLAAAFGWTWMFILSGVVPLLWLLPYSRWVPKNDSAAIRQQRDRQQEENTLSMQAILASPAMWGTVLGTFTYMYFFYFCLTWMPTYFQQQYGLSLEATGWYTGVSFAGMALMSVIGGKAADAMILRGYDAITVRKAFTLAGLALATTQTLSLVTGSTTAMLFFSAFGLCAMGLASANYWALTHTLIPRSAVGTMVGFQNTAASLAGVVAPWLTGWMIDATGSHDTPIRAIAFFLGLGIVSYTVLVRERFAPKASRASYVPAVG
jgi:MFS transporter, ACS family, D-galactonate transporter